MSCNAIKCVSMNNQECIIRPQLININSNEPSFYLYSIKVNRYSGIFISSYAKLENCLFRAVILTKNINDIDEYKYFGYDIGFHRRDTFSVDKVFGRNCIRANETRYIE